MDLVTAKKLIELQKRHIFLKTSSHHPNMFDHPESCCILILMWSDCGFATGSHFANNAICPNCALQHVQNFETNEAMNLSYVMKMLLNYCFYCCVFVVNKTSLES